MDDDNEPPEMEMKPIIKRWLGPFGTRKLFSGQFLTSCRFREARQRDYIVIEGRREERFHDPAYKPIPFIKPKR